MRKQRIQDQLQLKYADECFVLTASYTETFVENAALDLKPDRTLMLRFELKHSASSTTRPTSSTTSSATRALGPKL